MGWLFGKKKKQLPASAFPKVSHEQSLSFNEDSMHDKVIHPDHIKAAAGVHDDPFNFDDHDHLAASAPLGARGPPPMRMPSLDEPSSPAASLAPRQVSSSSKMSSSPAAPSRHQGSNLYIKVRDYKRILGDFKDLNSELTHLTQLTKDLEHSEYNEEKNFLRMKDAIKKVHDKLLTADRTLFAQY